MVDVNPNIPLTGGVNYTSYSPFPPQTTFLDRPAGHYRSLYPRSANNPDGVSVAPYPSTGTPYPPGRLFRTQTQIPQTDIPRGALTYNTGTDANGNITPQGYFRGGTFVRTGILPSQPATTAVSTQVRATLGAQVQRELNLVAGPMRTNNDGTQVQTYTRAGYHGVYFMRNDGRLQFEPTPGTSGHISGRNVPAQIYDPTTHMWHRQVPDIAPPRVQPQVVTTDTFQGVVGGDFINNPTKTTLQNAVPRK